MSQSSFKIYYRVINHLAKHRSTASETKAYKSNFVNSALHVEAYWYEHPIQFDMQKNSSQVICCEYYMADRMQNWSSLKFEIK